MNFAAYVFPISVSFSMVPIIERTYVSLLDSVSVVWFHTKYKALAIFTLALSTLIK